MAATSLMMWVQLVLLLTVQQLAEAAKTSLVRNEQQLIAALRNHAVTDILLTSSITLTAKRWPGTPSIVLRRDLRVRGASHVTLDAAWLQQKLALAEGRTLRFEGLLLRRLVTHGDTGSDFIVYSPNAVVSISQCVHEMLICPTDLSTMLTYLRKLPRPADRAHQGEQDISLMDHMDCLATPMQQHCQPAGLLMTDVALAAGHAAPTAAAAGGVGAVVEYTGSYLPCSAYLSPSCVERYGLASCYDSMLSRLWWQQWLELHLIDCVIGVVAALLGGYMLHQWLRPSAAAGAAGNDGGEGSAHPLAAADRWWKGSSSSLRKCSGGVGSRALSISLIAAGQSPSTSEGSGPSSGSHGTSTCATLAAAAAAAGGGGAPGSAAAAGAAGGPPVGGSLTSYSSSASNSRGRAEVAGGELIYGSLLGTGSFGRVYSGMWGEQRVAIKVMEVQTSDKYVANEVRISHMLDHPNIVRCLHHEFRPMGVESDTDLEGPGRSGGSRRAEKAWSQVVLVLEYCDAGSLSDAIKDDSFVVGINRIPDMDTVLQLALDVARGMAYMHDQQLCHGDLASKNVLLASAQGSSGGRRRVTAKVADFGLSRWLPNHAAALCTMTCGTVTHQAPELLNHHQLSLACDVYSFGIILWELVHPDACAIYGTGLSASPWAVAQHIMAGGRPQFYTQCVPGPYKDLARECWDADPQKRPSFRTIVQQLEAVISQSVGDACSCVQELF